MVQFYSENNKPLCGQSTVYGTEISSDSGLVFPWFRLHLFPEKDEAVKVRKYQIKLVDDDTLSYNLLKDNLKSHSP